MIGLTDTQLGIVMSAARLLPVEERDTFLQRRHAGMRGGGRFTDTDSRICAVVRYLTYVDNPAHAALRLREW